MQRILIAVGLLQLAGAASLPAQQPTGTTPQDTAPRRLAPIEVIGTIRPSAAPDVGSDIPARVTILDARDVDAYEPRVLPDAMQRLAGYSSYDDLGSAYKLNISTRGFYASPVIGLPQGVAVFLDGVRMNEPEAAQVNFDLLPVDHITRIEVLSGNGSLLGRNALGGAINLITARGAQRTRATFEGSGGSFDTWRGEAAVSGMTQGGVDWYLGGGYNREGGWRQVTGAEQYGGFFNVGKLTDEGGIRFQGLYSTSRAETAGSLPETVFDLRPDSNLSANDYEDLWQFQGALTGYKQFGMGRASAIVYYRRHRAERFNANQPADPDVFGISYNSSVGYTADYRWNRTVGSDMLLSLRGGVDGSVTRVKIDIFDDSVKFGADRSLRTQARSPLWDIAPFLMADLNRGPVTLSAGVWYDYVRIPFENRLDPSQDTVGIYKRFNPRVGATVEVMPDAEVFASWGQTFRAPAVIENACADPESPCPLPFALGDDPPLAPVTASTFEGGFRYHRGGWGLNGSAYYSNIKNDIFLTPYGGDEPGGSTIDGYFINLEKTRRVGVELGGGYHFPTGHSLYLNYAYTRATFESEANLFSIRGITEEEEEPEAEIINPFPTENHVQPGSRLPLVPDHQVKAGGRLQLGSYLNIGADARYVGPQWLRGDEANVTEPLDDYIVTDARVAVAFAPWEITGLVTNLFDRKYPIFGTYNINQGNPDGPTVERFLTPGQERMFRLIVRYAIGGVRGAGIDPD